MCYAMLRGKTLFSARSMNFKFITAYSKLGSVVQRIVSLTSSLRGQLIKCFMTL